MDLKILLRIQSIDKKILLFIASQIFQYVSSFVIIKLLASRLSVTNFGLYNLITTTCFVISMLPFTAFDQILNRKIALIRQKKLNIAPFLCAYFCFLLLIHLIFIAICFFLPDRIHAVMIVIVVYSISNILKNTLIGVLNFTSDRDGFNCIKILDNVIKVIVIFLLFNESSMNTIFLWLFIENVLILFIWSFFYKEYVNIRNLVEFKIQNYLVYLISCSTPLLIWAPFELIQNNLYVYFLEFNHFNIEVGYFSFYNSLSLVIPAGIAGILISYVLPKKYEMVRTKSFKQVTNYMLKTLSLYFILTSTAFFILIFVLKIIVTYLSKTDYLIKMDLFNYFYFANLIFNGSLIITNIFFAYQRQKLLIPVKVIPGLIALILLIIFTPRFGLDAVKYIFTIVSALQIIIVYVAYLKLKKVIDDYN